MQLPKFVSYGVLCLTPLFFSSNLLFGKTVVVEVEPWTLAFLRWGLVSLILLPFVASQIHSRRTQIRDLMSLFGIMGFLGMWICGAIVYYALTLTSATNATLIYLSSPVLIILIENLWRGRRIVAREALGILITCMGVMTILLRGEFETLQNLDFNIGDLAMVFAAIAWAVYSVLFKSSTFTGLPSAMLLCLFSGLGALLLLPFAATEMILVKAVPCHAATWVSITGIVFSSSIVAFLGYQYSVRFAGPAITGIFMYLLPVYGVGLAVLLLGEDFYQFHLVGIMTILGGVILATLPTGLMRRGRLPIE